MGNVYRFVEPVLLFLLKRNGRCHGYELASHLREYALTDSEIEIAALYRTLRQLEENGCVRSAWKAAGSGPARRVYTLTARGEEHLQEWLVVLDHMCHSMKRLVAEAKEIAGRMSSSAARAGRRSGNSKERLA